jgi:hypothetical protein
MWTPNSAYKRAPARSAKIAATIRMNDHAVTGAFLLCGPTLKMESNARPEITTVRIHISCVMLSGSSEQEEKTTGVDAGHDRIVTGDVEYECMIR